MQNANVKKFTWIAAIAVIAVFLSLGAFTVANSEQPSSERLWLAGFVGQKIVIGFIKTPPDLDRFVSLKLLAVDYTGVVVSFPNKDIVFLPYANIMSIERDPN